MKGEPIMNKYLVQFDESNIGIAWSKGEIIEAETEEEAIDKAINRNAQVSYEFEEMKKGTVLYTGKSLADFEKEERAYTWKATLI
jgi:hypothetical protein